MRKFINSAGSANSKSGKSKEIPPVAIKSDEVRNKFQAWLKRRGLEKEATIRARRSRWAAGLD